MIKYVIINGSTYDVPANATIEEVKAAAVAIDPSLTNSDATLEGDTVTFRLKAGTKGSN